MSELEPKPQNEDTAYTPASPVKRALAWIGVVYMLILVALTTCFYFTGAMLTGLAPLLVVPALVGLGIVSLISFRSTGRPGKGAAITLAAVCWILAALILPEGIAGLLANFR